nr:hypothetical protein [Candidatus Anoxychlamydiales bacterium]
MKRNIVVFINAPNTHDVLNAEKTKVTSGVQHSDW